MGIFETVPLETLFLGPFGLADHAGNQPDAGFGEKLRGQIAAENVEIAGGGQAMAQGVTGGRVELWRPIAVALLVVLMLEHSLAWWFGQKRAAA